MSNERFDAVGLSIDPKNVAPDCWYYEERGGLHVYFDGKLVGILPWRKVEASVKRYQKCLKAKKDKRKSKR